MLLAFWARVVVSATEQGPPRMVLLSCGGLVSGLLPVVSLLRQADLGRATQCKKCKQSFVVVLVVTQPILAL